ncbi:peptide deformylase [Mycoplasma sp. P36-A1]|uniref:peptide deformylase n=1 Tax=Mycoplasma sp. P36-A1 TaxID=3252900 RepID=UPI003C2BF530
MENILKRKYITNEDIIMEPSKVLNQKSENVAIPLSKEDKHLLKLMYNHVSNSQDEEYAEKYDIRSAVGIAAVQLGVLKKLIAIKTFDDDGKLHKLMLANPEIIKRSKETAYLKFGEGCLSVEDGKYTGIVPRSNEIVVKAFNLFTNKYIELKANGYFSIVLQHEIDHLDGIMYNNHINKLDPKFSKEDWICI